MVCNLKNTASVQLVLLIVQLSCLYEIRFPIEHCNLLFSTVIVAVESTSANSQGKPAIRVQQSSAKHVKDYLLRQSAFATVDKITVK